MNITEILMRPGGWKMSLIEGTPSSVIDEIRDSLATYNATDDAWDPVCDGQIVVFDTDTDVPSLASARYVGPIRKQDGIRSWSGPGISAYIQTDDGLGNLRQSQVTYAAQNISAWLDDLLPQNGITKGTATTTGLSSVGSTFEVGTGRREMLDAVCARMGAEWVVNTDGTLDAGQSQYLFVDTPEVVITDRPEGVTGSLKGVRGVVTSPTIDCTGITSRTIVAGEGVGDVMVVSTANSSGTVGYDLAGAALSHNRAVNAPSDDSTSAATLASAAVAAFEKPRSSFGIKSGSEYIRRDIAPGDNVYAYFPEAGIRGGSLVTFRGEPIFPQTVRVQYLNWGVHEGHGVYLRRDDGTETWLRLTPYVQWSKPGASWVVGTDAGTFDASLLSGSARLGVDDVAGPAPLIIGDVGATASAAGTRVPDTIAPTVAAPTYAAATRG